MNKLRERAGYKTGEDRSKNVDGGQAYKNNPYCSGKGGGHSSEGAIYWEENTIMSQTISNRKLLLLPKQQ